MKLLLTALGLCVLASASSAADLKPTDFAFGLPLSLDGSTAIYKLAVPDDVYRRTMRTDLGDVRVFNADGEVVPYSLWTPPAQAAAREPLMQLPVFPLHGDPARALDAFRITVASGKTAVDLQPPSSGNTEPQILSYVIDARMLDKPIAAFELQWPADAAEFSGRVSLESSNDLNAWALVAGGLPIANLNFAGQHLIQGRIEFPPVRAKFFRASWQGRPAPFALSAMQAEPARAQMEPARSQLEAVGSAPEQTPDTYEFDLGAHAPVDRVNLKSSQSNTFVRVALASRNRPQDPWRTVTTASIYDLQSDGQAIRSNAIAITANSDRFWQAQVQPAGGIGHTNPTLQAAWIPHEITFIARGNGPFQLAFGSATALPATSSLQALLGNQQPQIRIGAAVAGPQMELGGPSRLIAERPAPWKKWLLWGTLGAAVGLLAGIALRLSREMSAQKQ